MRAKWLLTLWVMMLGLGVAYAQPYTLFLENFETGGTTFDLNATDFGNTSYPNYWTISNNYAGATGQRTCNSVSVPYAVSNVIYPPFYPSPQNDFLHTTCAPAQAIGALGCSYVAADASCFPVGGTFVKMNTGVSTVGYSGITLSFAAHGIGSNDAFGEVYFSNDGGLSWLQCLQPQATYSGLLTWGTFQLTDAAFENQPDLRFGFRFFNGPSTFQGGTGWGVDNVRVSAAAYALRTDSLTTTVVCPGDTIQVPFSIFTTYAPNNVFTAEISNSSGSFASPTVVGTLPGTTNGSVTCVVPPNSYSGIHYRFRVLASNPLSVSDDSGQDVIIQPHAMVGSISASPMTLCGPGWVSLSLTGTNSTLFWQSSAEGSDWNNMGQSGNPLMVYVTQTTYFRAFGQGPCDNDSSEMVMVTVLPTNDNYAHAVLLQDTVCEGDSGGVQIVYHGNSATWYTSTDGGATWLPNANSDPITLMTPPLYTAHDNWVRAIVDNGPCGYDTIETHVPVITGPTAAFSFTANGSHYNFTDLSTLAQTWDWDFGDGGTSTLQNPSHTYAVNGNYLVRLTVTGPNGCTDDYPLYVASVGVQDGLHMALQAIPNPFTGALRVRGQATAPEPVRLAVHDVQGRVCAQATAETDMLGVWEIDLGDAAAALPAGIYNVEVQCGAQRGTVRVVKAR